MAQLTAGTWNLDNSHSEVNFIVRHAGISKVRGSFNTVSGTAVVGENFSDAKIDVTIDLASINTRDENRDGHLKSADFFDVENHPHMTFVSTEIKDVDGDEFTLVGDLQILGNTRQVELKGEFGGETVDPFGMTRAGFEAKGEISRKEFGLTWNAALETGGVLVGDKVKIEIDASFVLSSDDA
ncbi:YceI family protein [Citricoccus muralis]|uniref:YceI family protein n=1 Tax=Citricoccus muralis TaxID=169134 RepID=A0ABY8H6C7_9MICC|nr:YceI family protein [Citricoccus muralis]WFP16688.1 YceI family protein [Citricoccus muralis]